MRTERPAASGAFQAVSGRTVAVDFDSGSMTSNAGAPPLGRADAAVEPVDRLAACFEDHRDGRSVKHSVRTLVGRRAFGIVLGDEDSIDRDLLRGDPIMAVLAGKLRAKHRNCAPVAGSDVETWVVWFTGEKLRRLGWDTASVRAAPGPKPAAELADGLSFRVVGKRRDAGRAANPAPPPEVAEDSPFR